MSTNPFRFHQLWILILLIPLTFLSEGNQSVLNQENNTVDQVNDTDTHHVDEELADENETIPLDVGENATGEVVEGEAVADGTEYPVNVSGSLNETTANVSSTSLNETKPVRTVAYCALPEGLELQSDPILTQEEPLPLNENSEEVQSSSAEINVDIEETESNDSNADPETQLEAEDTSTAETKSSLRLVNMTELVHDILWSNTSIKSRVIPANCSIVLFYASWCPFSAKAAPHFNALPRAFPALRVAAIDVSQQTSVNSYFGILSVPTVILYHNGRSIAKFNESSFSLHKFAEFIQSHTDLRSDENINVTSQDFAGPVPSVVTKGLDMYLILAWVFIAACFFYYVTKSTLWRRAIDLVRTTWREAEDHVHQD